MRPSIVMFGHSHFLGDLLDIIHDPDLMNRRKVSKIVTNMPEEVTPGRLTIKERVARVGYEIQMQSIEDFRPGHPGTEEYVMGFSGPQQQALVERLKNDFDLRFSSLVHYHATFSPMAKFGEGCVLNNGAIVAPWARIGSHVFINRGAMIGHDAEVSDYAVIGPGVNLCGYTRVGFGSTLWASSIVIPDRKIGKFATVAAGAVVREDVPDYAMVAGIPATIKKFNAVKV